MAGAVGTGLPGGHVGSQGISASVGLGLLGDHDGFRGIVGTVSPKLPFGHIGSQGMVKAVGPRLPPAILVPGAWRELWAQGYEAAMFVPGPCSEL